MGFRWELTHKGQWTHTHRDCTVLGINWVIERVSRCKEKNHNHSDHSSVLAYLVLVGRCRKWNQSVGRPYVD